MDRKERECGRQGVLWEERGWRRHGSPHTSPQRMREGGAMPNGETQGCRGMLGVAVLLDSDIKPCLRVPESALALARGVLCELGPNVSNGGGLTFPTPAGQACPARRMHYAGSNGSERIAALKSDFVTSHVPCATANLIPRQVFNGATIRYVRMAGLSGRCVGRWRGSWTVAYD